MQGDVAVIGLGFGDEGKGLTTSFLCSKIERPLVVRFNGGHQAGHTVVENGVRHVFSSFGSGTLQGVPTMWSHYCTFYPTAYANEHKILLTKIENSPVSYVHPLCPVTTPFDVISNKKIEDDRGHQRHGSVGVGFGTTIQRHESYYKLYVQDLPFPKIVKAKLKNIEKYYGFSLDDATVEKFLKDIEYCLQSIFIVDYDKLVDLWGCYPTCVYEGAQGVLLDQDYGFFPNVTRSNTTCKNAMDVHNKIEHHDGYKPMIDVYYITRTYQTRHGAGFMSDEKSLNLKNNEDETNVSHNYQGNFRIGELDVDLLNYAMQCNRNHSNGSREHLVITCMDQYPIDINSFIKKLDHIPHTILISNGPDPENITEYKI